ncbi:MAG: hypothetical protein JWL64_925 [Frankiales bacterium]|nr:hypothetical protein [Frankiales bacterium]
MTTPDLDLLSTDDLRERAFDKARGQHDVGFFWDVVKHLRASRNIAGEDGSGGGLTGSIGELVDLVRELGGHGLGDDEPLLRAKFLDYLRS